MADWRPWLAVGVIFALYLAKLWRDIRRARQDAARLIDAAVRRVVWNEAADDGLSPARRARAARWIRSLKDEESD